MLTCVRQTCIVCVRSVYTPAGAEHCYTWPSFCIAGLTLLLEAKFGTLCRLKILSLPVVLTQRLGIVPVSCLPGLTTPCLQNHMLIHSTV